MKLNYLYILVILIGIESCESIVDVKVNEHNPYLVVDAWLTHEPGDQVIRLTTTQPYYENSYAQGVTNAQVKVTDGSGNEYDFIHQEDGDYLWSSADTFGTVNELYFLEIIWDGNTYTSSTQLPRLVTIDSITYTYEEASGFGPAYYYAEFFGRDPDGLGDAFWLKAWKNGKYLNRPSEIYTFDDVSFSEENGDGIPFIFPIRTLPNPFEQDINANTLPPYFLSDTFEINPDLNTIEIYDSKAKVMDSRIEIIFDKTKRKEPLRGAVESYPLDGAPFFKLNDSTIVKKADSVYLELHAISPDAYFFLARLQQETNRPEGFGALFATPPADVPTNIVCNNDEVPVVGFFNIANVSRLGRKLTEEAIRLD